MMIGKEKIYFLLDAIDDARAITPSDQPLVIDPTNDLNRRYRDIELAQLFTKLEKDERVLKVLKAPSRTKEIDIIENLDPYDHADDGCWHIELLPAFDNYFLKIQQEPEYQEFTGKKPPFQKKTKLSRKALEKIWGILQEIEDKRGIRSAGEDIPVQQVHLSKVKNDREAKAASDERLNILKKLENEDKAIIDIRWPKGFHQFGYLKIGDRYFEALNYYKEEYKKAANDYQQSQEQEKADINSIAYEVKYSDKVREILINNFLLAKPDFNSENDNVFSYLYRNANRAVKIEELEQHIGGKLKKTIHNILRDLGFTGNFTKTFFSASKNGVIFRNPITYQDLKELGINRLKIQEK